MCILNSVYILLLYPNKIRLVNHFAENLTSTV